MKDNTQRDSIVEAIGLSRRFGKCYAVKEASFVVHAGEVFGFLGEQGAGKTTLLGLLLGLLWPTAGMVRIFGEAVTPGHTAPLRHVGSTIGMPSLLSPFSVRDHFLLLAHLYPDIAQTRIDELLELVGLQQDAHQKVRYLSAAQKQRLLFGLALFHSPKLLILDEPTLYLESAGKQEFRQLLQRLARQGITIILGGHLPQEMARLCDRIAMLQKGHIVAQGTISELQQKGLLPISDFEEG
ncbi:ABC-2 type transport system ATP-binding protein [Thermosporothrix hazakensis]|jgi:ABC-2 type transport system ATP-binding protein|uniref:ABC-2 type transport system ATP-binding protein n=1 Tax=Thermosporothrix hazakensis TaxID=644383 RepID=A0A326U443_THEHA|nr:ABC transporter ATP-binding protein [Thermosporothrix hazakensis]PZW26391.1 ABC-2 type transport system ATP-binding protein [Thermosporothrix hazakensis]GCE48657.1 hypothetical protein KTH_35260 [Thermosporothrix hazakensis]